MQLEFDGIDHVVVPVADLASAADTFERLGLRLTPSARHAGMGTENRVFFTGTATSLFYVELIGIADAPEAATGARGAEIAAAVGRGGLLTVMLRARDLTATAAALAEAGLSARVRTVARADGSLIGRVADLDVATVSGFPISVIQYDEPQEQRFARYASRGLLDHAFPLVRLDHLTAVSADPSQNARFWRERLGVQAHEQSAVTGSDLVRLKIGDAWLQVHGPGTADSAADQTRLGPLPDAAFQVADLDLALQLARAAGFTPVEAPFTAGDRARIAVVPAAETGSIGLTLTQLLM